MDDTVQMGQGRWGLSPRPRRLLATPAAKRLLTASISGRRRGGKKGCIFTLTIFVPSLGTPEYVGAVCLPWFSNGVLGNSKVKAAVERLGSATAWKGSSCHRRYARREEE